MYLYLVQPVVLKSTNRYKVGMSSLDDFSRLKAYGKGTRVLMTIECEDYRTVEQKVIKAFNFAYKRIAGNEYFEIDTSELEMINLFVATVMDHKNIEKENPKQLSWMSKFAYKN